MAKRNGDGSPDIVGARGLPLYRIPLPLRESQCFVIPCADGIAATIPFGRKWAMIIASASKTGKMRRCLASAGTPNGISVSPEQRVPKKRPLSLYLFTCGREVPFGRLLPRLPASAVAFVKAVFYSRERGGQTEWWRVARYCLRLRVSAVSIPPSLARKPVSRYSLN